MARLGVRGAIVDGAYVAGDVDVADGVITSVGLPPGSHGIAIPGFVDLQVNGFAGIDFAHATEEQWREANRELARTGVTHYVANLISTDIPTTERVLATARGVRSSHSDQEAHLVGVNLEGPFLSDVKAGIHPKDKLQQPVADMFQRWVDTKSVAMTTIAPELPGALELIRQAVAAGVCVSLGHSNADVGEAQKGFDAGATTVTHLFNGMSGISARTPGLAGVALARPDIWLQIIADGIHVDPVLLRLVMNCAPHRIVLVSDCLPIAGTSDESFLLDGKEIRLSNGRAVDDVGVLAGSVLTMQQALENMIELGMDAIQAINAATVNPRRALGLGDSTLSPGAPSDLVVLSDEHEVTLVHVGSQRWEAARKA
jgi:N-acetylglucosamine-6-phosphate deacetylase